MTKQYLNHQFKLEEQDTGAKKHSEAKLRVDLITSEMEEGLAEVLTYGATKYEDRNWEKGLKHSTHYAAAKRHMLKFWKGIDLDDESGLHHIAHAMCNLAMLYTNIARDRQDLDDRCTNLSREAGYNVTETDLTDNFFNTPWDSDGEAAQALEDVDNDELVFALEEFSKRMEERREQDAVFAKEKTYCRTHRCNGCSLDEHHEFITSNWETIIIAEKKVEEEPGMGHCITHVRPMKYCNIDTHEIIQIDSEGFTFIQEKKIRR